MPTPGEHTVKLQHPALQMVLENQREQRGADADRGKPCSRPWDQRRGLDSALTLKKVKALWGRGWVIQPVSTLLWLSESGKWGKLQQGEAPGTARAKALGPDCRRGMLKPVRRTMTIVT